LDRLQPGSAAYNIPGALRLRGRLVVSVLGRALEEVVRRHDALRTTFEDVGGEAVQRTQASGLGELAVEDLSGLASEARERRVCEQMREEAGSAFDLSQGPLVRARLLKLSTEEHVLLFTMHHIVSDGWSMGVLVREVASLYGAYLQGGPSPLPELAIQYADYAAWQRQWLQGAELQRQLEYWKASLQGMPLVLELATDRPRPAVQTLRGATLVSTLSGPLKRSVQQVSQRHGATEFMTLLSAFAVLMSRYSGQSEMVIGSPIANRTRQETEGLIGFFVNTLALGLRVPGDQSFATLLGDVKERTLGAYAHQQLPFEKLVEALAVERDLSRTPVFQVMFALQNAPSAPLALPGLELTLLPEETVAAKFDLTLSMHEQGDGYALCRCTSKATATRCTGSTTPTCSTARRSSAWRSTSRGCWARRWRSRTPRCNVWRG
jgi:non-ribosomal peptide synthetase component F